MNCCNPCDCCSNCQKPKDRCRCPDQLLGIENLRADNLAYLTFNDGGRSVSYDFEPMIKATETDTSISVEQVKRMLKFMAERHIDYISAKELGAILHIADIGDVDITGVTDNSLFVYSKDSDCGSGCEGINNSWYAWNANEHLTDSLQYLMGFDADGKPLSLNTPAHTDQYYQVAWRGGDKLGYTQPKEVASAPVDSDGKVWRAYIDPTTKELVYVKGDA